VAGRHRRSMLCSSQAANEPLTGNLAGHGGFGERSVPNDRQAWATLLPGMEPTQKDTWQIPQKPLQELDRCMAACHLHCCKTIRPRCVFTSAMSWLALLLAHGAASTGQRLLLGSLRLPVHAQLICWIKVIIFNQIRRPLLFCIGHVYRVRWSYL